MVKLLSVDCVDTCAHFFLFKHTEPRTEPGGAYELSCISRLFIEAMAGVKRPMWRAPRTRQAAPRDAHTGDYREAPTGATHARTHVRARLQLSSRDPVPCLRAFLPTYSPTCLRACPQACPNACPNTGTHAHIHACAHARPHAHTHARARTHAQTRTCSCMRVRQAKGQSPI